MYIARQAALDHTMCVKCDVANNNSELNLAQPKLTDNLTRSRETQLTGRVNVVWPEGYEIIAQWDLYTIGQARRGVHFFSRKKKFAFE